MSKTKDIERLQIEILEAKTELKILKNDLKNDLSEEQKKQINSAITEKSTVLHYLESELSLIFVANKLKKARLEKKLTLKQVADKIGVTPQLISQYERALRNPKKQTLDKILKALDCTYESLNLYYSPFGIIDLDHENIKLNNSKSSENVDNKETDLLKNFRTLTDTGKQKVIDYSKDLAENPKYRKDNK